MTDSRGGNVRRIDDIAPWRVFSGLDAGRRGDHPVVVGARNGDEFGLVVLDESGTVAQLAAGGRGEHDLVCPSWNDGGDQILAMRNTSDIDERRLQLIDLTGERTSRPLDLPFTVVGCSAFITDDRLVVADAALTIDGPRACGPSALTDPTRARCIPARTAQLRWVASIRRQPESPLVSAAPIPPRAGSGSWISPAARPTRS
jgi:hypothetical protein